MHTPSGLYINPEDDSSLEVPYLQLDGFVVSVYSVSQKSHEREREHTGSERVRMSAKYQLAQPQSVILRVPPRTRE